MHWLSFLESMRGVVVAKLTSRTGEPQETTSSRKIWIPCTNLDCILKMKQQQHDINLRRTRKKIRVPGGIWTHDPPWSWLATKYFVTNQKQGNPNASGTVSVRVSFPEALPFFIWSMLAVISFVNISCRLACPRMAIIKAILCLQTSASLSLWTPAKSKASFKNPCLSVRNIDPITASASCHTRFQFLWWRVSEWPGAAWDWVPGLFWGGCKENWKMALNEPVRSRVSL